MSDVDTADPLPARRRKSHGSVRMELVAKRAGVSAITVSRVLNHPDKVAEDTRARVWAAIEATGYIPNLIAGGLASSRTRVVGIIVPTITNSIFADTVQGMTDVLARNPISCWSPPAAIRPRWKRNWCRPFSPSGPRAWC